MRKQIKLNKNDQKKGTGLYIASKFEDKPKPKKGKKK